RESPGRRIRPDEDALLGRSEVHAPAGQERDGPVDARKPRERARPVDGRDAEAPEEVAGAGAVAPDGDLAGGAATVPPGNGGVEVCAEDVHGVRSGRRRPYGKSGCCISPVVSSSPNIRLKFWIACPAEPFTRLSRTEMTIARPGMRSG